MSKYLLVFVYRNNLGDCTNNGVTSPKFNNTLVVPCEDGNITEEDVAKGGYVVLEPGTAGGALHFKPRGTKKWTMAGGNFVHTSDSRFSNAYGRQPVSVHDRIE